jgi:predicted nucleotidyltransferase
MKEAVIHSKQKALEYYQKRLLESKIRNHIASIILYGSLIHGMGREDSDIDLLIIALDEIERMKTLCMDLSFEVALKFGESVEPLIYCIDETRFPQSYFLYSVLRILRKGKGIYQMDKKEIKKREWQNYLNLALEFCTFYNTNIPNTL